MRDEIELAGVPPTTVPATVGVRVRDFTNADAAQALGRSVLDIVLAVGSFVDLSTLDGVTIAIDYDGALADLDRGMERLEPLGRTDSKELQGVAKTCEVVRDGQVRSHLVFNAVMLVPLIAGDAVGEEDRASATGIVAHECGHVESNARNQALVPDARLGAEIRDGARRLFFPVALILWDEYAVCRRTARFAPSQNAQHAQTVLSVTPGARERSRAAIRAYRIHGDRRQVLGDGCGELVQVLKTSAYLLGGMDAEGLGWDAFPAVRHAIGQAGYAELVDALHAACRSLWDSRDDWLPDVNVMARLVDVVRDTCSSGGIFLRRLPGGDWLLEIPITNDTLPGGVN